MNSHSLSIDPGPKSCGIAADLVDHWYFNSEASLELIKTITTPLVLIEVFDWPIALASDPCWDTCIMVGRLVEYFTGKSTVILLGRKATTSQLPEGLKKNDSGMIEYCKACAFKRHEGLKSHAWQALGQLLFIEIYRNL